MTSLTDFLVTAIAFATLAVGIAVAMYRYAMHCKTASLARSQRETELHAFAAMLQAKANQSTAEQISRKAA